MTGHQVRALRIVCVARHQLLAEHVCAMVRGAELDPEPAVGLAAGRTLALERRPDVVVCDYDLLALAPAGSWFGDERLETIPLVAVSLTRRPDEVASTLDSSLSAFLYLPMLTSESVGNVVRSVARGRRDRGVALPASQSPLGWDAGRNVSERRA